LIVLRASPSLVRPGSRRQIRPRAPPPRAEQSFPPLVEGSVQRFEAAATQSARADRFTYFATSP